jgi:hypothetical protein
MFFSMASHHSASPTAISVASSENGDMVALKTSTSTSKTNADRYSFPLDAKFRRTSRAVASMPKAITRPPSDKVRRDFGRQSFDSEDSFDVEAGRQSQFEFF